MKKIKVLFLLMTLFATIGLLSSCEKETVIEEKVYVEITPYNADNVYLQDCTENELTQAMYDAISKSEGAKVEKMADTCKSNLKQNLRNIFSSRDKQTLKKYNVYWEITVKKISTGKMVDSSKLYASDL